MYLAQASAFFVSLLLAPLPASAMLHCENVLIEGHSFNLKELGGPHSVVTSRWEDSSQTHYNTTYTVDICEGLSKGGGKKEEQCPTGTRGLLRPLFIPEFWDRNTNSRLVCAIERSIKGDTVSLERTIAIAGSLENYGGSKFEYDVTRLKTSDSNSDAQKEGLRLVLKGGKHPLAGPVKERRSQRAVIEFICDPEKTGLEGEWETQENYETKLRKREDGEKDKDGKDGEDGDKGDDDGVESAIEHQLLKNDTALIWQSYGLNEKKDADVLRMTWYTKHACESSEDSGDDGSDNSSSHWGFFTWLVIM